MGVDGEADLDGPNEADEDESETVRDEDRRVVDGQRRAWLGLGLGLG